VAGPRSIFNATITFGLVNVPIKLHSATQSQSISFREVHISDGAPIQHRKLNPKTNKEVDNKDIAKGYEVAKDEYVVLSKDEVAAAAGEKSKVIEIEDFVSRDEIDPVFYDKTYYLGAREGGEDAYALLREALKKAERVGIGRMVFHNREYLVGIRPLDDKVLGLHTMRFADEVVDPSDVDIPAPSKKPADKEVKMAQTLVEALTEPFKPDKFEDTYRDAVLDVVKRKASGEEIAPEPPEPDSEQESDLMAVLEASLKARK
jgi:DNA end-binding protein Ku